MENRQTVLIELYSDSPLALEKAHARFGGSQGLLRCALQSIADAGKGDVQAGASQSILYEIHALRQFMSEARLWVDARTINSLLKKCSMIPGKEHRLAFVKRETYVIKSARVQALVIDSPYNYLTDISLSNHYFGDDRQLIGCYEEDNYFHLITKQPYVNGQHPSWDELKSGLVKQGLRDPNPSSKSRNFIIDDEMAGEINVCDLHVYNVILDSTGWLHPIDAHFEFHDRASRMAVFKANGLDTVTGPSDLMIAMEDNESDFFKP